MLASQRQEFEATVARLTQEKEETLGKMAEQYNSLEEEFKTQMKESVLKLKEKHKQQAKKAQEKL
jgi:biotin-(acetyl-CoA carboxylase) ligase